MIEDGRAGWHHGLKGHEFEQRLRQMVKDGEAWCPWGHKELDTTK